MFGFFAERLATDEPLDPDSDSLSSQIANLAEGLDPWGSGKTITYRAGIAIGDAAPPVYEVGGEVPRVRVVLDNQNSELARALAEGVPIPEGATPAGGIDRQMIVYQPSSDTLWELWRASLEVDGWHADYGGRIRCTARNPGYHHDLPDPAFQGQSERHTWGGTSSKIAQFPGLVRVEDLSSGTIGHAIAIATWVGLPGHWVWPAQYTDARTRGPITSTVPQGARFRLPADFDAEAIAHPICRMLAVAARDYGMVIVNTTGAGVMIYGEGQRQPEYHALFVAADSDHADAPVFLHKFFPWGHLQALELGPLHSDQSQETVRG